MSKRLGLMKDAQNMMVMSSLTNNLYGFETGMENYADAAWDKLFEAIKLRNWASEGMALFKRDREEFFRVFYDKIFEEYPWEKNDALHV